MSDMKLALEGELKLVEQLINGLDKRSGAGILYVPENLQSDEEFEADLVAALTTPIIPIDTTHSFCYVVRGPAGVGADLPGDRAFLYTLFDRASRLRERIKQLEELDTPDSLV